MAVIVACVAGGGVFAVRQLASREEDATPGAPAEPSIDDIIDIVEGAARTAPPTLPDPESPAAMFGPSSDGSTVTDDVFEQLSPASIVGAQDLIQFRVHGFTLRSFAGSAVTGEWTILYDPETDFYTAQGSDPGATTPTRWVYLDSEWQYNYVAGQPMTRVARQPGAPAINPTAPYRRNMDLRDVFPPDVIPATYTVPIPAGAIEPIYGGEPVAYLVDLAGLRGTDPTAATRWVESWRVIGIDDPTLIDRSRVETKPDPGFVLGAATRQWTVDTSTLRPPAGAALVIALLGANAAVIELAIVAPDDGLVFQYWSTGGFDGKLQSTPTFLPDGWLPA